MNKDMHEQSLNEVKRSQEKAAIPDTQDEESHPNIFRTLLASNLPDPEKGYHRIAHDGFEILAAGSATFSRVAVAGTYHILANKEILEKLRSELNAAFPDPNIVPETKQMEKLPYLVSLVKSFKRSGANSCLRWLSSRNRFESHKS